MWFSKQTVVNLINVKNWDFRWLVPRFFLFFSFALFVIMMFLGFYIDVEAGDAVSLCLVFSGISGIVGILIGFVMCYWIYFSRVSWKSENVIEVSTWLEMNQTS